ncbi:SufE family protein [Pseudomonas sp. F1_0610]|uniref:SufE family protein n=1 Tax=Pseudomonas sp. F1_0610 TaxID=3114284 RepID=UPI0039C16FBB
MRLSTLAQQTLDNFAQQAGWEQRARLLLQYAEQLPALTENEQHADNQIHGCQSQVWLVIDNTNPLACRINSPARLLKGLFALLLIRINGLNPTELTQLDIHDWFTQLGLQKQLSPSRANGLNAVYQAILQQVNR